MTQRLFIECLFVSSFIVCSKCCISLSSGGCARGSIAFGGRLVLVSNDGAGLGDISQPFIFVTPFAFNSYLKSPLGYGRGQIWIGKRDCLGYGPQSQIYCPTDESRPCLDTTTPCFSDPPAYTKSEPLEFSDITEDSLRVSWPAWNETTDLGVGPVNRYKLQYKEEGGLFDEILLDAYTLQYQFDGLKVGTTYEFRITLIRDFPYIESQPSNVQNATTLYGEPPAYIQDYPLNLTIVTDNSITVTWPVWDETTGTGTGPITGYKLQYREQGNDFQDIVIDDFTVLSSQVDGLKEDINDSELLLTTESKRTVKMVLGPGMEGGGREKEQVETEGRGCTRRLADPPAYTESEPLKFSDITEDSLRVSWPAWNETTDLGVGPVTRHKLQYREEGGLFDDILLDAYTLQYQIDGLKAGTTYEFRIILIRDLPYIESHPSSVQNETTLYGAPPSFNSSHPLEFSNVTDDSVTVTWSAWNAETDSGVGPVTQHKLQYREKGGSFKDVLVGPSILSHRFDGLKAGTEYEFRIILIRVQPPMEGQPSMIQTVTTLPPEPPAYMQDYPLNFTIVTDNSITVTWPVWDETTGTGTGPITGYKLKYREQGNDFQDIVIDDFTVLSRKVDGLKEGTTYQFRIILVSGTLEGTPSLIQNETTSYGAPPSFNSSHPLEFSNVTDDSVTVTWSAWNAETDSGVGPVTQHKLQYREKGGSFKDVLVGPSILSHRFDGLRAETEYEFRITLMRVQPPMEGQPSMIQIVTTLPPEPPAYIQDYPLNFTIVTDNSITVTWPVWDETTGTGTGPITGYKLQYREQGNDFQDIVIDDFTVLSRKVDGLKEGTTYQFRIILVSGTLEGTPSLIQNETTSYGAPPSFNSSHPLEFSNVTDDSVTVTWSAWNAETDSGVGPVTQHKLQYREKGGSFKDVLVGPSILSHRFDGLKAETEYEFRIILIRVQPPMEGQPSMIQTVTTLPPEPPAYIQDYPLNFTIITDNSITVTWPVWDETTGTGTGSITGYKLQYREQGNDFQDIVIDDFTVLSRKVDGLKEGTTYQFRIILVSGTLQGTPSLIQNETTSYEAPPSFNSSHPLEFSNVTDDSVTVTWSAWNAETDSGIGPVTQHKLQYREKGGTFKDVLVGPSILSHRFDGLRAETEYEFRITLMRVQPPMEGQPSMIQTVTTLPPEPPAYIQDYPLNFTIVTDNSITVTWPVWDETTGTGTGPITGYKLKYREQGNDFQDIVIDDFTVLSSQVDGLKEGTTYQFRIILVSGTLEGTPSLIQNETTSYGAPPSFNSSHPLEFSSVTDDSVTVTWPAWNAKTDSGIGPVTQHKLQYREKGGTFKDVLVGPSILSHRFDGLKAETEYEFRITLMRIQPPTEGQPSMIQPVTTLPPEPPAYIQDYPLHFSIVTDNSITVTWPVWDETTGTGTGPVTGYKLQYREQGNDFQDIVIDDLTVLSSQVDGLKEGTTYQFRIILVSGTLEGTPSLIQNETTSYGAPPSFNSSHPLEFSSVTDDSVTVTWPAWNAETDSGVGPVTQHKLQYREKGCTFKDVLLGPSILSHRLHGLKAEMEYEFRITLIRVQPPMEGQPSMIQTVTTSKPGCARGSIFFGGRLVLVGNNGTGLGNISQPFIFVTPFAFNAYHKSPFRYGRGQIWIGKRNCLGHGPQSQIHCPTDESLSCLDTTAPCLSGNTCK
ncbi:Fibronectin [Holothuria leucospilota]|uniref:Fibronectin n=1 Tax=Holothuria leucospilota TaxID=206669 RepID=A0A9Q1GZL9_HOLLE|nr:Fibronectin [Holothuria leucospilota]